MARFTSSPFILVLFLALSCGFQVGAFVVPTNQHDVISASSTQSSAPGFFGRPKNRGTHAALQMASEIEEPKISLEVSGVDTTKERPVWRDAMVSAIMGLNNVLSVAFWFIGIFGVCGITLNLMGYGYQMTDHGFVVDTLDNMRLDAQFQNEIIRSMNEAKTSSLP
jgi:hypothetical protein